MDELLAIAGSDPPLVDAVGTLLREIEATESAGFLAVPDECSDRAATKSFLSVGSCEWILESIGAYQVVRQIGEGATGIVYEALAPAPAEREVAIKVLRAGLSTIARARAVNEIQTQARLNHAGIAQLYDSGTMPDGRIWIATELVRGPTITEGLRDCAWDQKVRAVARAAMAVQYAHQRGVVHRDLKPSNILLRMESPDGPEPKIIDFGVATTMASVGGCGTAEQAAITVPGMLVGTLAYMSPEQLHGREIDARTDVYALGLILAELLAGDIPGERRGGISFLLSACERPVSIRLKRAGGRERDLEAVVAKATDPQPELRYPTVQHLADDLQRVLRGEPAQACRASALRRAGLLARRHPWSTMLAVGAILLIGSLVSAVTVSRARLAAEVADQRTLIRATIEESLDGLRHVQGTSQYRAAIVNSLLQRCEKQVRTAPNDRELLLAKARLLLMRGDIEAALGDERTALDTLNESLALFGELRTDAPHDVSLGRQYAEAIVRVGDVGYLLDRRKNAAATLERYQNAMAVQDELLQHAPNDLGLLDDLTWSYDRIGDRWSVEQTVDDTELERWLKKRIDLSQRLLELDENRMLSRFTLAMGHYRLARFARERDNVESLARSLDAGLPLIRSVVQEYPAGTATLRAYTHFLSEKIDLLVAKGDALTARETIIEAMNASRRQAQFSPGDAVSRGVYLATLRNAQDAAIAIDDQDLAADIAMQREAFIKQWNND